MVFNYPGGITIEFVHVGTQNATKRPTVPKKAAPGHLVEIGWVGGYGDTMDPNYNHTHIVFFSDKSKSWRLDPRKLFCGW